MPFESPQVLHSPLSNDRLNRAYLVFEEASRTSRLYLVYVSALGAVALLLLQFFFETLAFQSGWMEFISLLLTLLCLVAVLVVLCFIPVNHLGRSATRIRMRAADVGDGPDEDAILRFEAHARKVPGTDRMLRWAILVVFVLLLICIVLLAAPGLGRDIWDEIQYRMQPAPVFPPVAPLPPPPPPAIPPTS